MLLIKLCSIKVNILILTPLKELSCLSNAYDSHLKVKVDVLGILVFIARLF